MFVVLQNHRLGPHFCSTTKSPTRSPLSYDCKRADSDSAFAGPQTCGLGLSLGIVTRVPPEGPVRIFRTAESSCFRVRSWTGRFRGTTAHKLPRRFTVTHQQSRSYVAARAWTSVYDCVKISYCTSSSLQELRTRRDRKEHQNKPYAQKSRGLLKNNDLVRVRDVHEHIFVGDINGI